MFLSLGAYLIMQFVSYNPNGLDSQSYLCFGILCFFFEKKERKKKIHRPYIPTQHSARFISINLHAVTNLYHEKKSCRHYHIRKKKSSHSKQSRHLHEFACCHAIPFSGKISSEQNENIISQMIHSHHFHYKKILSQVQ